MQFSIFTLFVSVMATAVSAQTTYETGNYLSVCQQGNTLFCTGNVNMCQRGKTDTFDEKATKANEEACKGLKRGDNCVQTVGCV